MKPQDELKLLRKLAKATVVIRYSGRPDVPTYDFIDDETS